MLLLVPSLNGTVTQNNPNTRCLVVGLGNPESRLDRDGEWRGAAHVFLKGWGCEAALQGYRADRGNVGKNRIGSPFGG